MSSPTTVEGVGVSRVFLPAGSWTLLLDFLDQRFPDVGRAVWQTRLRQGRVSDDSGQSLQADAPYIAGRRIHYFRELPDEPRIPFDAVILHRDDDLLVVDKPHFLPTMPAGRYVQQSLLVRLKRETGLDDLVPLHRLDRATAGLVMFSIRPSTRAAYTELFASRRITKVYEALAPALPGISFPQTRRSRIAAAEPFFRMHEVDGVANADTNIDLIETRGDIALYRLQPQTGRKHQLRVHMAAIGAAILNDPWYPQLLDEAEDDYTRPLKLLARALSFRDPLGGDLRLFESRRSLW
ncbi:pseudouridine synthase [Hydrocarboniphaga sp.]|uniref:pseudouridine synthase n=1 Tax=Hydrocarboniphaga sp. TaxID=2033016 RepID=UPI003D0BBE39